MEENEVITRSLLVEEKAAANDGSSSSSITIALVLTILVVASGSFACGCATGYSSPAESGIMKDLGLSIAEYSVFGSIFTIGGMLGALVSGKVADLIGRRGTPIYTAEITPKNMRGGFTAFNQLSVCAGLSLIFFIGNLIPWRSLALIGSIPCVVQTVGLFFIPESPRWLVKVGREKEVEASLQRLRGKNVDISQEAAEIRDHMETLQQLSQSSFLDLFQKKYVHSLIVGVGLMLLVQFGGTNGISFYASSIFEAAGSSTSIGTTGMAIIQIPFSILCVLLMDKFGRRPLLAVTAAGAFLGSFLAGLAFLLQDFHQAKELTATLVLVGMLVYAASFSMGLGAIPWVIMSEIFPMNIKGSAGSLATLVSWFGSWIVSYAFNFLFEWSSAGVFFIFATICGSIVLFVTTLMPETKGRTLEEIQASMV